jgi:hypothetical protein
LALLIAGGLVSWLVVFYPARLLWGDSAVVFSVVALLLCLAPAIVTLIWSQRAFQGTAEQQLLAVMGGTAVRMLFVVGAALVLFLSSNYFHEHSFLIWVVVFYLITLTLEMYVLVSGRSAAGRPQNNG